MGSSSDPVNVYDQLYSIQVNLIKRQSGNPWFLTKGILEFYIREWMIDSLSEFVNLLNLDNLQKSWCNLVE